MTRPPYAPTFIVAGAPKCGTTTLHALLKTRPDVHTAFQKELNFFDCLAHRDIETYWAYFEENYDDQTVIGEATPYYLFPPDAPRNIHEHLPDIKLVFILRDPIDRAVSDWWMHKTRASESLDMPAALRASLDRARNGSIYEQAGSSDIWRRTLRESARGRAKDWPYVEIGHYGTQLQRYLRYFDRDQIHITFLEDLAKDKLGTFQAICEHIGAEQPRELPQDATRNQAVGPAATFVYGIARKLGIVDRGHLIPGPIRRGVRSLLRSSGSKPPLDPELRNELVEHYDPEVRLLEKLAERDLSHWLSSNDE